jgi:L-amino acid N-acyltransferase YncA
MARYDIGYVGLVSGKELNGGSESPLARETYTACAYGGASVLSIYAKEKRRGTGLKSASNRLLVSI